MFKLCSSVLDLKHRQAYNIGKNTCSRRMFKKITTKKQLVVNFVQYLSLVALATVQRGTVIVCLDACHVN